MKKTNITATIFSIVMLFACLPSMAQSVVNWKANVEMKSKTDGVITITATIEPGWHIYGLEMSDDGPIPTTFEYEMPEGVTLVGKTTAETPAIEEMDDMFGCKLTYWENKAVFKQKIKVAKNVKNATGVVKAGYMTCNDSSCRPPCTDEIKVTINKQPAAKKQNNIKQGAAKKQVPVKNKKAVTPKN